MRRFWKQGVALAAVAAAISALCSSPAPAKPPAGGGGYVVRALDANPGTAYDIQGHADFAEVVGEVSNKARYWQLDGTGNIVASVDLSSPATAAYSAASGINSDGLIVGWYDRGDNTYCALAWASSGSDPIELPVPAGVRFAGADHINDNWLVIGWFAPSSGLTSLVAWQLALDDNGKLTCVDHIVIATAETGVILRGGLNNDGYVVNNLGERAWRWQVVWDDTLGLVVVSGQQLRAEPSIATGINQAGTVCGTYVNANTGRSEGYALKLDGTFHKLNLKVASYEQAYADATAINDASPVQVAGEVEVWRGNRFSRSPSVLWDLNGGVVTLPLNDYSSSLTTKPIFALDDSGWAVGTAELVTRNQFLPFLLKPR
jgi:hypothetical protein